MAWSAGVLPISMRSSAMVVELGLPVTLAGLFLAISQLISPVRIWLEHLSAADPLGAGAESPI